MTSKRTKMSLPLIALIFLLLVMIFATIVTALNRDLPETIIAPGAPGVSYSTTDPA